MLCFVWKSIQAENDAMEGNPSMREALMYHRHSSGCHRNLPGTNAGSHQFGLLETSAQMCWSTSRNSTTHKAGTALAQQSGRTRDRQHRPGMLLCLPEMGLNINMLCKKNLFQAGPQKFLGRSWICVSCAPAVPPATAQGPGSVPPTVLSSALPSYLPLLCLASPKHRRKLVPFQSPMVWR